MLKKYVLGLLLVLLSPELCAIDIAKGEDWQWSISGFGTLGA